MKRMIVKTMKITLNKEEKRIMKKHRMIKLSLLLPEDYFGHYYIEFEVEIPCVKVKKRGLKHKKEIQELKE